MTRIRDKAHSKTWRKLNAHGERDSVLECGAPAPLCLAMQCSDGENHVVIRFAKPKSAAAAAHSKTWRKFDAQGERDSVLECGAPAPLWELTLKRTDIENHVVIRFAPPRKGAAGAAHSKTSRKFKRAMVSCPSFALSICAYPR